MLLVIGTDPVTLAHEWIYLLSHDQRKLDLIAECVAKSDDLTPIPVPAARLLRIVPRLHLTRCKVAPRYVDADTYKSLIDPEVSGLERAPRTITKYGIAWIAGEEK